MSASANMMKMSAKYKVLFRLNVVRQKLELNRFLLADLCLLYQVSPKKSFRDKCIIRFNTESKDVTVYKCFCLVFFSTDLVSVNESKIAQNANFSINRSDEIFVTFTSTRKELRISNVKLACEPVICILNQTLHTAAD